MDLFEKTLSSKNIFSGRIFTVTDDEIELPNGKKAKREVVSHSGGVCVLPLDNDGNIYLVKQFRYPYKEVILEIPAGKKEKNEEPLECGKRELLEEIGATSEKITNLGELYPTPGYCGEVISIFLAENLSFSMQNLDEDEFLEVVKMPFVKALEQVLEGEIKDSKTQVAILKTALVCNYYIQAED